MTCFLYVYGYVYFRSTIERIKHPILHPSIQNSIPISHPTINERLLTRTRRNPLAALPRLHFANIHGINLLQSPPLRLAHKEIHDQDSCEIAGRENVSVFESNITDNEGREEGDEEVPDPVRGRHERHAASAVVRREKLADNAPDDRTPCRGVEGDEKAREDDHRRAGGRGGGGSLVVEREGADGGED